MFNNFLARLALMTPGARLGHSNRRTCLRTCRCGTTAGLRSLLRTKSACHHQHGIRRKLRHCGLLAGYVFGGNAAEQKIEADSTGAAHHI